MKKQRKGTLQEEDFKEFHLFCTDVFGKWISAHDGTRRTLDGNLAVHAREKAAWDEDRRQLTQEIVTVRADLEMLRCRFTSVATAQAGLENECEKLAADLKDRREECERLRAELTFEEPPALRCEGAPDITTYLQGLSLQELQNKVTEQQKYLSDTLPKFKRCVDIQSNLDRCRGAMRLLQQAIAAKEQTTGQGMHAETSKLCVVCLTEPQTHATVDWTKTSSQ